MEKVHYKCNALYAGLLIGCDGAISHNRAKIASDRIIEKSHVREICIICPKFSSSSKLSPIEIFWVDFSAKNLSQKLGKPSQPSAMKCKSRIFTWYADAPCGVPTDFFCCASSQVSDCLHNVFLEVTTAT